MFGLFTLGLEFEELVLVRRALYVFVLSAVEEGFLFKEDDERLLVVYALERLPLLYETSLLFR